MLKKFLKVTGITLVALIAILLLVPVLFKTHITNLVKKEINKSVNAKVDFKDVSLSLFRHFPRISITLQDLSVIGMNEFANDTLIKVSSADATVNLFSVIKGNDIKVSRIYLESPKIDLRVNEQGKANWDIAMESESAAVTDTSASEFQMTLKYYRINNAHIRYNDETTGMHAEFAGVDHEGSGDFTKDVFTLKTSTQTSAVSFVYGNIPYLLNTKTGIDANIMIDNSNNKYSFKTDDILLNSLKLSSDGFFQILNDSTYFMDIRFHSPSNDFKDILSMIPVVYSEDFDKLNASGQAVFKGFIKGIYSPQQMPAFDIDLEVKDGNFNYPDLPRQVKNVQMSMHVSNPDGEYDNTIIDISKAHFQIDNEPVDLRILYKQPETVRYIDAAVKGKIDLAGISKFLKLDKRTRLSGILNADAFIKGSLSAIQDQNGQFIAGGFFDIKNLSYSSRSFTQPLHHVNMKVKIDNAGRTAESTSIIIDPAHIELGKDQLDFTLNVSNPFTSMDMTGKLKAKLSLANLEQFMTMQKGTKLTGAVKSTIEFAGNKEAFEKQYFDKIKLNGTAQLNNIKFVSPDYPKGIVITTGHTEFIDQNVTLTSLSGSYLNTKFKINGSLKDVSSYIMNKAILKGNISMTTDRIDLNKWMGTNTTNTSPASTQATPFVVPADIDITVNAKASEVEYDKVDYRNVNGTLLLKDETVVLQNVKMDALGGKVIMGGSYSTRRDKMKPEILVNYDIKEIDVQRSFLSYNTVRSLMPIGQFLSGKLSSQLSMNGTLDRAMMPDMTTLTGNGNILLIQGVLKKFAPLEKIASTLQIDELKDITIRDIKNSIEFANGQVLVKPFNLKVKDIEMQIGGTHGFDRTMNYIVAMKVPKKYIGVHGYNIVDGLVSEAKEKGIEIKTGEIINLHIKVSGSITNPSIQIDLEEVAGNAIARLKQQANDFAKDKYASAKQTMSDTVMSASKQFTGEMKNELREEFNKQFFGKDTNTKAESDSSKKKPVDKLKKFQAMLPKNKKTKTGAGSH